MNTNFFNQIQQLEFQGNLQLNIAKGADNTLIVSAVLLNEQCGDNAKNIIPPFNLRGTAQELDEGFFEKITTPIETVSGLMDNMEVFLKQLEVAKMESAMVKGKAEKEKKETDTKSKKFTELMEKVDALDKEGKHKEAWMRLPKLEDHPEQAETIRKRRTELSAKFAPDLFGSSEPQVQTDAQEVEIVEEMEEKTKWEDETEEEQEY